MRNLGLLLFAILIMTLPKARANNVLMRDVNASAIESEHLVTEAFWLNEEVQQKHLFFAEAGGDKLALKELNLRAVENWKQLGDCVGRPDGKQLAEALLNLETTCPDLQKPFEELNRNYIEFLSSAEFSLRPIDLDKSPKYGRIPLHPVLQQFSFNYYVQVVSVLQFKREDFATGKLSKILSYDLEELVLERKNKEALMAEVAAAYKAYVTATSFWDSRKAAERLAEVSKRANVTMESIDAMGDKVREMNRNWDQTYRYRLVLERFLNNNFLLSVQNMIYQFPTTSCRGIGIYEYSNLSGTLVYRLERRVNNAKFAEQQFRSMIHNFCNHKIHHQMSNWQIPWQKEDSDPLPEAIELSRFHRKFPLEVAP